MPVTVTIEDHELEAMRDIVLVTRAIAPIITPLLERNDYRYKMINMAQMIEDILSRIETS